MQVGKLRATNTLPVICVIWGKPLNSCACFLLCKMWTLSLPTPQGCGEVYM